MNAPLPSAAESLPPPALLAESETGFAVAEAASGRLIWHNRRFAAWFLEGGTEPTLAACLPEAARREAATQLPVERLAGGRPLSLAVTLRPHEVQLLIEAHDVTQAREAEYLLDSYSAMAERHARELSREKERAEKLLLTLMPRAVYEELKEYGTATPQRFDQASVLMLDFLDFTRMVDAADPGEIISELNDIFSAFDRIVELFGCERIKTIGDAYMAVSGLPETAADHAVNVARAALRMRRYLERRNQSHARPWRCRIGIASGAVIGSLVGIQKYVYDIFGPTVNLAARLEQLSHPMGITLSDATLRALGDGFCTKPLGLTEVKGLGSIPLHSLLGEAKQRF